MKHTRLRAALLVLALAFAASGAQAAAASITIVEGSPIFFGGATFAEQDGDLKVQLDWVGLASDIQWDAATFRLGAAVHPGMIAQNEGAAAFTLGLGIGGARIFNVLAAAQGSVMGYIQNTGEGSSYALAGTATGATGRVGLSTNFGLVPQGFHTAPARMIGQEFWPDEPGRDLAGKGWVNLTAALQTYKVRTDLINLGYMHESGTDNWRGDVAYIGKYRPENMGLTMDLTTGLAFGNQAFALVSKLGLRADITDASGAAISVVGQSGDGAGYAWISGSGWLGLGGKAAVTLTVSAPLLADDDYIGPELFRPIDAAAVVLSLDFVEGIISRISGRYDLRTQAVGLELAATF